MTKRRQKIRFVKRDFPVLLEQNICVRCGRHRFSHQAWGQPTPRIGCLGFVGIDLTEST
jgi:hypothetical protein